MTADKLKLKSMLHMPLFQIDLFIARIPGRSNISRKKILKEFSNCFANQESEKKLAL